MKVELIKEFTFEAAHRHPEGVGAGHVHGHSYRVAIGVSGNVDPVTGWLIDFGDIKTAFEPLYFRLDHRLLNEVDGLSDVSVRGIESWIRERLHAWLPFPTMVRVGILGDCIYKPVLLGEDHRHGWPARIRFGFEAAHHLPGLPPEHKCRRLHGHSFHLEVGAARLDGIEELLAEVYEELDHRCLNDVAGLENATSENLSAWVWRRLAHNVKDLRMVMVQETCTARCIYRGDE